MRPKDKDQNTVTPGRSLGDIDPTPDRKDEFPQRGRRDRADDRDRSTRVNDDDVGAGRRDREPADPQRNPRTGPIA